MDSFYRRQREEVKRSIVHDFIMAEVQLRYFGLEKGKEPPHPWEYYTELFAEEKIEHEKKQQANDLEEYKARRRAYAQEFNRRRNS